VLLNERGEVSECTSANVFVASGREVATPPLSSGCLPGVTRELLLAEVRASDIGVIERTLVPADLERADEVFITSTTRDLIAVSEIEGLRIRTRSTVCGELVKALQEYRRDYIKRHATTLLGAG